MTLNIKEYIEVAISDLLMFLLEDIEDESAIIEATQGTQEKEFIIADSDEFENILFNSKKLNELKSFKSLKTYMMSAYYKMENINDIKKFLKFYNAVTDEAVKKGYYVFHKDLYVKLIEIPKELNIVLRPREELEAIRKGRSES